MTFGIIKERKNPPDRRVVFSPEACQSVLNKFPEAQIVVEPSDIRVYADQAYRDAGLVVSDDLTVADVLLGVKEVPIDALIPNKKYFFFSHTIKKQPYNRELLRAVLEKNIELYDHEVITNQKGQRLVAFGRYAGLVGAYNGIRTYGLKFGLFDLPKAETLPDLKGMIATLKTVELPPVKILLTGKGRVGGGAKEILDAMRIREVSVEEYLHEENAHPVYCQLDVLDYNRHAQGEDHSVHHFYFHPEEYESDFMKFARVTDMFIAGHYYGDGSPYLFTREDARSDDFKIRVVADISCDIDGPVATTIRPSTIEDPIYGYDAGSEKEVDFKASDAIAVMAVDNLPCELPADASVGFGESFLQYVIPAFFDDDAEGILERARMTKDGKLTERYSYLQDYVDGTDQV
ncbi:alanine dehydrogenase [Robertkochia marina]|uniref:Saccharopine dehydrogenase [NAD(+), L-lysine-forming] n=1 Tax=Robertkochia marina TaxID=1227945 RepID=A0A4S3M036_9FLAO|nr:NAD(P)-dependent oxidoreductase [Robertkochia marina]THD66831.1 alanine dehydrogenase [Robertkochia marina]TRZ41250.1 alanine dehydrogenase [Robertkochia marina]